MAGIGRFMRRSAEVRGKEISGFSRDQLRPSLEEVGDFSLGLELIYRRGELVPGPLAIAVAFRKALSGQFQDTPALWRQGELASRLLSDARTRIATAPVLGG